MPNLQFAEVELVLNKCTVMYVRCSKFAYKMLERKPSSFYSRSPPHVLVFYRLLSHTFSSKPFAVRIASQLVLGKASS